VRLHLAGAQVRPPAAGGISAYSHGPRGMYSVPDNAQEIAVSEAVSAVDAAYAHCPRCDSERYTQQPVRS
jgi:hypothetical protein